MILQYSLEVGICWAVFYLLFISFFKRETFFHINRSYLLVTLIIGLLLPLIKYYGLHLFTEETTMVATLQYISAGPQVFATSILTEGGTTFWSWRMLLIAIYVTGLAFTLSRVVIGLLRIRQLNINGTKEKKHDHIIVHTFSNHLPFSFFNTIYLSGTLKFNKDINDILHHELTHVKRRHSLDVMFIELLGCLFWWNPIIYLYKREIKIIHEYVADAYALIQTSKSGYKQLISNQYSKHLEMTLANHFFNTNLKNRINMINQKSSSRHMKLKYLAIIPISVLLLIAFSGFMQKENADVTFYKSSDDILYTVLDNRTNEVISITTPSVVKYYEATGTDSPIIIVNGQRVDPPLKNHIVWNEKKCISYQPDATDEYGTAGKNGLIFISPNNLSSPEIESLSKIEEYEVGNALDASDHHTVHEFEYNANGKTTSVSLAEMPLIDFFGTTSTTYKKDLLSMEFTSIYERTIPHTNITACKKLFEALLKKYTIEYKGQKEIIKSDFHKIVNLHGMRLSIAKDLQFTEFLFNVPHFSLMDYNQVRLSVNGSEAKNGIDYIIDTESRTLNMLNLNESIEQGVRGEFLNEARDTLPAKNNHVYKNVDVMPRYPGCEKMLGTEEVKKSCADGLMLNHIYRTLKYPSEAREKGIEGMVVLKFIVGKDGRVRDADILRNLNGGCGQAALAAVESMYDMKESWMPGKKDGVAVDVEYFLPVKFKLAKEKRIRVNL